MGTGNWGSPCGWKWATIGTIMMGSVEAAHNLRTDSHMLLGVVMPINGGECCAGRLRAQHRAEERADVPAALWQHVRWRRPVGQIRCAHWAAVKCTRQFRVVTAVLCGGAGDNNKSDLSALLSLCCQRVLHLI